LTLPHWPRAWGEPPATALLKQTPEDFEVEEILGFEPDGDGEHQFLWVEKRGVNTADVAKRLAAFAGLREADVSWAGLKDRQALTRQWFSLQLPGRVVDWSLWSDPDVRLLRWKRHSRKLRRGSHRGNRFVITLRELRGDREVLAARLQRIAVDGVPNYFGSQRFGRDGRNLVLARRWAAQGSPRLKPAQRGLHLSVLRAFLFNSVLAARVADGSWRRPLVGDLFMLDGSASFFAAPLDETIDIRMRDWDIHPTGPLYGGAGKHQPEGDAAALEAALLAPFAVECEALANAGVDAERRALRLRPDALAAEWLEDGALRLGFSLLRGCFATSVVRELARLDDEQGIQEMAE
jgi:tRNA pseudouridine13 synthase